MTLPEKIDLWHRSTSRTGALTTPAALIDFDMQTHQDSRQETNNDPGEFENEPEELPDVLRYRELIRNSPAYGWLVESARRETVLTHSEARALIEIRQHLTHAMPSSSSISRNRPSEVYNCAFRLAWNPKAFVAEQRYTCSPRQAIANSITLTEDATLNPQALTTSQYMAQTWSVSGVRLLQLIQQLLGSSEKQSSECRVFF